MSQTLLTIFSFFWVNVTPYFHVWTAFFETVTQWFFISYKPSYCFDFSYITLFCVNWQTFLPLFLSGTVPFFLFECHKNTLCVLSLIFAWMSHMHVSIFFVWMSHEYPYASITLKWTRYFLSFLVKTDPFFLSFGNIGKLFITTFIFPM